MTTSPTAAPTAAPDVPPTTRPTSPATLRYVCQADPTLAQRALTSDLTSPAKLALLHVLCHPIGAPVARQDLADAHPSIAEHLDQALHELVDGHWLSTVPAGEPPCRADWFQLRPDDEDLENLEDQDDTPPRGTHLAPGVTWVTGGPGSDGRG